MLMRPKHSLDRLPTPKTSGHDLMRSLTARLVEEKPGDVGMSGARPGHELSVLRDGPQKFKVGVDKPAHTRAPRYASLDGCEQDRSFPLNGSPMIKIDWGVRSILLAMPSLGARPG
jgi:hypothetical protein